MLSQRVAVEPDQIVKLNRIMLHLYRDTAVNQKLFMLSKHLYLRRELDQCRCILLASVCPVSCALILCFGSALDTLEQTDRDPNELLPWMVNLRIARHRYYSFDTKSCSRLSGLCKRLLRSCSPTIPKPNSDPKSQACLMFGCSAFNSSVTCTFSVAMKGVGNVRSTWGGGPS